MNRTLLSLSSCALSLLGLTTFLTSTTAQAQIGPQKGYVVPLSGDTLRGTVVLARAARNAQQCEFQAAGQAQPKLYQPAELRAYGTEQLTYESQRVPAAPDSAATLTPAFLEVLTRGPYTLYGLVDSKKQRFFLGGYRPGQLVELTQAKTVVKRQGREFVATQRSFQDTLARAFRACPEQAQRVKQYSLDMASMQRAVRGYNTCVAPQTVEKKTARRGHFDFGLTGGYAFSDKLRLGSGNNTEEINSEYDGKSYAFGGVEVVLTPGFNNAPFTVHTGVLYEQGRKYQSFRNFYPSNVTLERVTLGWSYIVVPIMIRYAVGRGMVRPYAEAGGSIRYMTKLEENELYFERGGSSFPPSSKPLLNKIGKGSVGMGGGAGAEIHLPSGQQFSLGFRAESISAPAVQIGSSKAQSVSVLLSYIFTK